MKKDMEVSMVRMVVAIIAVLSLGLVGCSKEKTVAPAAPDLSLEQSTDATAPSTAEAPKATAETDAAADPANAKPKDHPAH